MQKLNLGCGYVMPDDWVNVDKLDYGGNVVADVLKGLPYPDEYFDFVLMNHTLQMFKYEELPLVLCEVRRVMKPEATLRILTPDVLDKIYDYFSRSGIRVPISPELEPTRSGRLLRYIFWHGDTHCAFDDVALGDLLTRNGFSDPRISSYGKCGLDSRKDESLIMEATK